MLYSMFPTVRVGSLPISPVLKPVELDTYSQTSAYRMQPKCCSAHFYIAQGQWSHTALPLSMAAIESRPEVSSGLLCQTSAYQMGLFRSVTLTNHCHKFKQPHVGLLGPGRVGYRLLHQSHPLPGMIHFPSFCPPLLRHNPYLSMFHSPPLHLWAVFVLYVLMPAIAALDPAPAGLPRPFCWCSPLLHNCKYALCHLNLH